ncbi:ABC transporter substrate-binding protein [Bradyrhizobium sp.]|uniref:ABC transporter substrate-binding protein n=1 Tax=Bradyrhizobium sp. TaxID=376 RepID=UPI003C74A8B2
MRRREFIGLVSGAAAWPLEARAQRLKQQRIVGALLGIALDNPEGQIWVSSFRKGMEDAGWIEGGNLQLELRWPAADTNLMHAQAVELLERQCEVVVTHASPATVAFREVAPATANVFVAVVDPIASGFVASISHPGGNSTGFTNFEPAMGGKWLELLKELTPACSKVGVILNPKTFPGGFNSSHVRAIEAAANTLGMSLSRMPFHDADEIREAFGSVNRDNVQGLLILPDTSTTQYSKLIVELAAKVRAPAVYPYRDFVNSGGLLCYGVDRSDLYRRASSYVDRILRGAKPADLPVQTPIKFELVINLKTAKALGLSVPQTLLASADEVIE